MILKTESQNFRMTFWLMVVHHNTKIDYKRLHTNTHQGLLPTVWHRPGERSDVRYPSASPLLHCWSPRLPPSPPATAGCAGGLGQPLKTQQSQNQLHTGAGDREKLKADRHWRHSSQNQLHTGAGDREKLKADRHWRHSRVRISNFMLDNPDSWSLPCTSSYEPSMSESWMEEHIMMVRISEGMPT